MKVWVELRLDDRADYTDTSVWAGARNFLLAVVEAVGTQGRLSLRVPESFALAARHDDLVARVTGAGHEVAALASNRRLAEVRDAVLGCGGTAAVCTPGLSAAGKSGRAPLLRQARSLGFRLVTDKSPHRAWAYEGLLPREEEGVVVMAPTVAREAWRGAGRLGQDDVAAVASFQAKARAHDASTFGVVVLDRDLCGATGFDAAPTALQALARLGSGAQASADCADLAPPAAGAGAPMSDRRLRMARAAELSARWWPRRTPSTPTSAAGFAIPIGTRRIVVTREGPTRPHGSVVCVHGGSTSGRSLGLSPFGLSTDALTSRGFSVWTYDRTGTGRSTPLAATSGRDVHTIDARTVFGLARADCNGPVVALTWEDGVLDALHALHGGFGPDAIVDVEGPVDRWTTPPDATDLWADEPWEGRELRRLVPWITVPYIRVQGAIDHAHGASAEHVRRLASDLAQVAHARLIEAPGRVQDDGGAVLETVLAALSGSSRPT